MPDTKREFYNVCPYCWSVRVKLRIFKSPRYKCESCGTKFPNKKRISSDDRKLFNRLMSHTRRSMLGLYTGADEPILRKSAVKAIKEGVTCLK